MGDQPQIWQVQADSGHSTSGEGEVITLPSGQAVTLKEAIWNVPGPVGLVTRFRFLAPQIDPKTGNVDPETAATDMAWICQNFALDRVVQAGALPVQIIVSLSDRDLPFGETAPEATQFFEAFRVENGSCIWEVF